MNKILTELRKSPAHIRIGKNGITEGFVKHLRELFKHQKIIKIKVLKNALEFVKMDDIIRELMEKIPVYILESRGHTIILTDKKNLDGIKYPKKYMKMYAEIKSDNKNNG